MDRRALLATAGTVLAAGCSEIVPPPQSTATDTDAPPAETTVLASATETAASDPTDTLQESTPEATTDEETATLSEAEREAATTLATATEHLAESHAAYLGFADAANPTLLDVTAAVSVGRHDVVKSATKATATLADLPTGASADQRERAEQLRAVATFLVQAIRCQSALYPAHKEFTYVVGRLYAEQFPPVAGSAAEMREQSGEAAGYLKTIREDTGGDNMVAFEAIDASTYMDKRVQFDREIDGFETLADVVLTVRDGLDVIGDAVDEYDRDAYRQARETFGIAADEFAAASDTIDSLGVPGSVADAVAELQGVCEALAGAATEMETAAAEAIEYNWEKRDAAYQRATEEAKASAVAVERIGSVQELLEL